MSGPADVSMIEVPEYFRRFSNFRTCHAVLATQDGDVPVQIELRSTAFEVETYYTELEGKGYRAHSLGDLLHQLPSLESLTIKHPIQAILQGRVVDIELDEILVLPGEGPSQPSPSLRARLELATGMIESELVETLQDAIWDLQEAVGDDLWLVTCFHCALSGHARDYLVSDRSYWCYRDVVDNRQDEIVEVADSNEPSRRYAGAYYVDAFHTCPAWRPLPSRRTQS